VANVEKVNLVRSDGVENEITQTGRDNYAYVRFVSLSSFEGIVAYFPRAFDESSDKA